LAETHRAVENEAAEDMSIQQHHPPRAFTARQPRQATGIRRVGKPAEPVFDGR
jgi:hypothetical protein